MIKNGSTTITQKRRNHGDHLAMLQSSQAEYSWKKIYVVYLVGSAWCRVLWVAQTERDHYWGSLSNRLTQLMRLSRALKEKRAHYYSRHDKIIFLHDNARLHIAAPVETYLETFKGSSTPSAVFSRHCSFRLPLVPIDDACLSSTSHHMKIPKIVSIG